MPDRQRLYTRYGQYDPSDRYGPLELCQLLESPGPLGSSESVSDLRMFDLSLDSGIPLALAASPGSAFQMTLTMGVLVGIIVAL